MAPVCVVDNCVQFLAAAKDSCIYLSIQAVLGVTSTSFQCVCGAPPLRNTSQGIVTILHNVVQKLRMYGSLPPALLDKSQCCFNKYMDKLRVNFHGFTFLVDPTPLHY
jgi:hypothetical protein